IETEKLAVALGAEGGGSRAVGEERHLADRIARAEKRDATLDLIRRLHHIDAHLSARDEIERVAWVALAKKLLAAGQSDGDEMRGEFRQRKTAEARKKIDSREQFRVRGD